MEVLIICGEEELVLRFEKLFVENGFIRRVGCRVEGVRWFSGGIVVFREGIIREFLLFG